MSALNHSRPTSVSRNKTFTIKRLPMPYIINAFPVVVVWPSVYKSVRPNMQTRLAHAVMHSLRGRIPQEVAATCTPKAFCALSCFPRLRDAGNVRGDAVKPALWVKGVISSRSRTYARTLYSDRQAVDHHGKCPYCVETARKFS